MEESNISETESSEGPIDEVTPPIIIVKPKPRKLYIALITLTVIILVIALYFIRQNRLDKSNKGFMSINDPASEKSTIESLSKVSKDVFLLDQVPNFDEITLNDLPQLRDYRFLQPYNGHALYVGLDRIIEYDQVNHKFIRASKPGVIGRISSADIIDTNLFVTTNSPDPFEEIGEASSVYKIDLPSGKIVTHYFGEKSDKNHRKNNPRVKANGTDLWFVSWDGIAKYDVVTDSFREIANEDIFGDSNCSPTKIFTNNDVVTVLSESGNCSTQIAKLDKVSGTWDSSSEDLDVFIDKSSFFVPDSELVSEVQRNQEVVPKVKLPAFFAISPMVGGKYFIVADNGLYSIERKSFPILVESGKYPIPFSSGADFTFKQSTHTYLSRDQKHVLFIAYIPSEMEITPLSIQEHGVILLVNTETQEIINLLDNRRFEGPITDPIRESLEKLDKVTFSEENSMVRVSSKPENVELLRVSLDPSGLTIVPTPKAQ